MTIAFRYRSVWKNNLPVPFITFIFNDSCLSVWTFSTQKKKYCQLKTEVQVSCLEFSLIFLHHAFPEHLIPRCEKSVNVLITNDPRAMGRKTLIVSKKLWSRKSIEMVDFKTRLSPNCILCNCFYYAFVLAQWCNILLNTQISRKYQYVWVVQEKNIFMCQQKGLIPHKLSSIKY